MQSQQKTQFHRPKDGDFGRLFPELAPLHVDTELLEKLAACMTEAEGDCTDSEFSSNGLSIFGQFLAHDMTFEVTSRFRGTVELGKMVNDRTYSLDLDCLYGQWTQDFLYQKGDKNKLLLGKEKEDCGVKFWDLQRNAENKAIIPDARNDENVIVSAMQVLFIKFHNCMVDHLRKELGRYEVFPEARRMVRWYYHWLIAEEYLSILLDPTVFRKLRTEGPQYFTSPSHMPVEFTGAAFRYGHSQSRENNRINGGTEKGLFEMGFFNEMTEFVDWNYLFNFGDGKVQMAKKIDTIIATSFGDIPFIKSKNRWERSLAFRNLRRGVLYGLPSGEDLAQRLCFEPIEVQETRDLGMKGTPLWFYILREAEILGKGEHLGPVGSTLLGEVFWAIMINDSHSFLKLHPKWTPTIGRVEGKFDFVDMVNFARGEENGS